MTRGAVEVGRAAATCRQGERLALVSDDAEIEGARVVIVTISGVLATPAAFDEVTRALRRAVALGHALPQVALIGHRATGVHELASALTRNAAADLLAEDAEASGAEVRRTGVTVVTLAVGLAAPLDGSVVTVV